MQQAETADAGAQLAQDADVIEVGVRVNEIAWPQAARRELAGDFLDLVAAVDDDRLAARFVSEDRAVAGERSDRKVQRDYTVTPKSR